MFTSVASTDSEQINKVFQNHYDLLLEFISPTYIDGVLRGSFSVRSMGDFNEEEAFLIFKRNQKETAYPFIKA